MKIKDLARAAVKQTLAEEYYNGNSALNARNNRIPEEQRQRAIEAAAIAYANVIGIAGESKGYQDLVRRIMNALDTIDLFASIEYNHPNHDWIDKEDFVNVAPYGVSIEDQTNLYKE